MELMRKQLVCGLNSLVILLSCLMTAQMQAAEPASALSSHRTLSLTDHVLTRSVAQAAPEYRLAAGPRLSPEQAIAAAQKVKPGRVLSVNQAQQRGATIYRVKILADNGRVSTVSIDAQTGAVVSQK